MDGQWTRGSRKRFGIRGYASFPHIPWRKLVSSQIIRIPANHHIRHAVNLFPYRQQQNHFRFLFQRQAGQTGIIACLVQNEHSEAQCLPVPAFGEHLVGKSFDQLVILVIVQMEVFLELVQLEHDRAVILPCQILPESGNMLFLRLPEADRLQGWLIHQTQAFPVKFDNGILLLGNHPGYRIRPGSCIISLRHRRFHPAMRLQHRGIADIPA